MSQPAQKPGRSKQDYGTPRAFLVAVEARFGALQFDLAASADNSKCLGHFSEMVDSLTQDWCKLRGNLWLNPPFANIDPWAAKCAASFSPTRWIFLLTPASIGTEWFAAHVWGIARVMPLRPRMTFDGTPINPKTGRPDPYPKDLMLSVFGAEPGFEPWKYL